VSIASQQLFIGDAIGTGTHTLYTAPANHRTIIKSLNVLNEHTAAQRVVFQVRASGGTVLHQWVVTLTAPSTAGESVNQQPWIVMLATQVLVVQPQSGPCSLAISGAELTI
jgi:hypothetical protein